MIYFIESESGHIKIGHTKSLKGRFHAIKTHCPFKIKLIKTIDGGTEQESLIHEKFKACCHNGEWFNPSQEILDFIENPYHINPKNNKPKKEFYPNIKMELNVEKIRKYKNKLGLTWEEIAKIGKKKNKQVVYDYIYNKRLRSAVFFAKVFRCKPKDLIK